MNNESLIRHISITVCFAARARRFYKRNVTIYYNPIIPHKDVSSLYTECLGDLAAQCGSCRDLHALWPYIRLSRSLTSVEDEGSNTILAAIAFSSDLSLVGLANTAIFSQLHAKQSSSNVSISIGQTARARVCRLLD
jgi:hypothetical protein